MVAMVLPLLSSPPSTSLSRSHRKQGAKLFHIPAWIPPTCDTAQRVWVAHLDYLTLPLELGIPFCSPFQRVVSISKRTDFLLMDTRPRQRTIPILFHCNGTLVRGRYPQVAVFVLRSREMQCIVFFVWNHWPAIQYVPLMVLVKKEATLGLEVVKFHTD